MLFLMMPLGRLSRSKTHRSVGRTADQQCWTANRVLGLLVMGVGEVVIFNPRNWSNGGVSNFLSSGFCFCVCSLAGSESTPHWGDKLRRLSKAAECSEVTDCCCWLVHEEGEHRICWILLSKLARWVVQYGNLNWVSQKISK